jgi:hypothetical protein
MPPRKERCFYCSNAATLLCDFRLGLPFGGYARGGNGEMYAVSKIAPMYTCDMPLCRDHAEYRGWLHIKASGPAGGFDSFDYCPEHRGMTDSQPAVMQESEAERLRRVVQANAQRRLMRERGVLRSPPPPPEQGMLF